MQRLKRNKSSCLPTFLPLIISTLFLVSEIDKSEAANLQKPKGTVSGGKVEFRWTGSKSETDFLWKVTKNGKTVDASRRSAKQFGCRGGGTCRFSASLSNGSYQWQVRPYRSGKAQSWTKKQSFKVNGSSSSGSSGSSSSGSGSSSASKSSGSSGGSSYGGGKANVKSQSQFDQAVRSGQKTIVVSDGKYKFPKVTKSGLTIKAANKGKVRITNRAVVENAQNVVIEGFEFISTSSFDAILCAKRCHGSVFRNNIIRAKNADYGIRVHRSSNVKILDNVIEGAFNHAISAKNQVFGMQVRGNRITDCGRLCIEAGQSMDGTEFKDETSDNIRVENNEFIGRSTGHKPSFHGLGVRIGNAVNVHVRNNKFTGNWRQPVFSSFGAAGPRNNARIGHFGSKHPKRAYVENNSFNGGEIFLGGRGRADDTIIVKSNKGKAKCIVRNFETRGSSTTNNLDWSTIYRGRPKVQSSGNSFGKCS